MAKKLSMTIKHKINTAFILLLFLGLITATVVIALLSKTFPLLTTNAIYFCQQFISNTLFKVPNLLPNTIVLALVPLLSLGILSFLVQLYKTYSMQKRLSQKRLNFDKRLQNIVSALGLLDKVYLIKDMNLFSFCSGIINQHIIITTSLVASLSDKELEAVLLHEQAHLKNLDPIKVLLGKTVSMMFFFLPIFAELNKNMIATNEILADNWTIKVQNGSWFLRSAIRKIIATPQANFAFAPNIASDSLEIRIHRLVNPAFEHKFHLSPASILTSILFVLMSWFLLQTPVNAFQMESQSESAYFLCSADNACRQECHRNAQKSQLSAPEELFSSQTPKYRLPSYK